MNFIKKLIPSALLKLLRPFYHGLVAYLAHWYFGKPSKQMLVVGVTGTAGKSTTVQMLASILNSGSENVSGKKPCGFITTISFFDGDKEYVNKHGLSMPGGWLLHKQLFQMQQNGCKYAVVECTSEGLAQNRHLGINFQMVVFTNLSPAHLEAHGSFQKYKSAKARLFQALGKRNNTTMVVNLDDENADYFLSFDAEQKIGITFAGSKNPKCKKIFQAKESGQGFILEGKAFKVNLAGRFNLYNSFLAVVAGSALGFSFEKSALAVAGFAKVPGRMEPIENSLGLTVFVDYGCEPASFRYALEAASALPHKRLIHVFGSTGGHRDKAKRFLFGEESAKYADEIVVTNDDVYDSDPEQIAKDIESGIKNSKLQKARYQVILDRREAVKKALEVAKPGDMVLLTGKGSEQFLVLPGNRRIAWDDRVVVRELLAEKANEKK